MIKKLSIAKIATTLILIALVIWVCIASFLSRTPKQIGRQSPPFPSPQSTGERPVRSSLKPAPDLSIYKTDQRWMWWNEQGARDPEFEWKTPIRFYGKVVDENEQPVAGAIASFIWTDMSSKGSSTTESVSDGSGLFSLEGVQGKRLQVRVTKEGYYSNPNNIFSFEYAAFFEKNYHEPNRKAPVIFRLRKMGETPRELLVRESLIGIAPDGTAQPIDLLTGGKGNPGNVTISIIRSEPKDGQRYDWGVKIAGVNGAGLIESDAPFMFEAPSEGYLPHYHYQFEASSPYWQGQLRKKYYVRSGGGDIYASLEIKFMPKYQEGAAVRVRFFVNPTGSRNLEHHPNKVLPR